MYLESVCADLLRREEKAERVFPNLPPHYIPQYRYSRGESGLQEKKKIYIYVDIYTHKEKI